MTHENFHTKWDPQNQIYHLVNIGNQDKAIAIEISNFIINEIESLGVKPVKFLVDLSQAGQASIEAQTHFTEFMKSDLFSKQAFVGMSEKSRKILENIHEASEASNVNFFNSTEDAIEWLKAS